jgi:hypothetical protein
MPLSSSHRVFAISPPQQLVDEVFPAWRRGASLLRDEEDRICGTLRFSREPDGGLQLEIGPEVPSESERREEVIRLVSELVTLLHAGECVLVQVKMVGDEGVLLEVLDFSPQEATPLEPLVAAASPPSSRFDASE